MLNFFLGKHCDLSNRDAIKILWQSVLIALILGYFFGPFDYSIWGLMKLAAS